MTSKFAFAPLHTVRIMPRHFLCFSHGLKQTFQMALEMKLTAKHIVKNENSVGCFKLFLLPFFSFLKASFVLSRSISIFILGNCFGTQLQLFHQTCSMHSYLLKTRQTHQQSFLDDDRTEAFLNKNQHILSLLSDG